MIIDGVYNIYDSAQTTNKPIREFENRTFISLLEDIQSFIIIAHRCMDDEIRNTLPDK